MKLYNVDVFHTVRVSIKGIPADDAVEAAKIANALNPPDLYRPNLTASVGVPAVISYPVADIQIQDLDALYYGVYPVIQVDGEPANDYDNETHLAGDFVTLLPGEEPQDRFKVMIRNLLGQITLVADKTIGFNQESLGLLNEVAREVGHPMFEFMEKCDGAEVDGYPRENCPPHLDYAEWVNPLMKADFEAASK
jgi:hypothetical protein